MAMHGPNGPLLANSNYREVPAARTLRNSVRVYRESWNGSVPNAASFAKPCLQITFAPAIMKHIVGQSIARRSRMSHYLLASGDLLAIAAIILSVAYLSWKQFSK